MHMSRFAGSRALRTGTKTGAVDPHLGDIAMCFLGVPEVSCGVLCKKGFLRCLSWWIVLLSTHPEALGP